MRQNSNLLLITGLLIIIASFCLVYSFDNQLTKKSRRILFLCALISFGICGLLVIKIMHDPLGM